MEESALQTYEQNTYVNQIEEDYFKGTTWEDDGPRYFGTPLFVFRPGSTNCTQDLKVALALALIKPEHDHGK